MKASLGWIVIALAIAAIAMMLTMSARAGGRGDPQVLEVSPPPPDAEVPAPASDEGTVLFSTEGTIGGEDAPPPALSAEQIHEALVAINPGAGLALPPPLAVDTSAWQLADAGLATMRVPADWVVQTDIGAPGEEDRTIGLSPPANDMYVELRVLRNADGNYMQALVEHARSEYARSPDRFDGGVILGFAPRLQGGAAGHVEVMNQFGKLVDEDGAPTFRLVLWRGRWERAGEFERAEFMASFAQDRYDEVAPLVNAILGTVQVQAEGVAQ
jgi:hypothetical protein